MKILITGGLGFIGSWLSEVIVRDQRGQVLILDNMSPQIHGAHPQEALSWLSRNQSIEFVRADVRDRSAIDQALSQCNAVVHLAAETGTGQSMYQIAHYYDVNQQATAQLLELIATKHKHIKKIVLASSRSIYGEGAYLCNGKLFVPDSRDANQLRSKQFEPLGINGENLQLIATPEHAPAKPASIYAATKLANESLAQVFAKAFDVSVTALRFQNVYGERQSLKNPYTGILSIFSNRMRQNLPINIFEDGLESRDFVHVLDVVQSVIAAIEDSSSGFRAINVGSGVPTTVLDIASQLKRLLSSQSELQISGDFRVGDIRHCYADISLAKLCLGYAPRVNLEMGLNSFVDWVLTQSVIPDRSELAQQELKAVGLAR